jgi:hypothetical protein
LIVIAVYVPAATVPARPFLLSVLSVFDQIKRESDARIVLLGDTNALYALWDKIEFGKTGLLKPDFTEFLSR